MGKHYGNWKFPFWHINKFQGRDRILDEGSFRIPQLFQKGRPIRLALLLTSIIKAEIYSQCTNKIAYIFSTWFISLLFTEFSRFIVWWFSTSGVCIHGVEMINVYFRVWGWYCSLLRFNPNCTAEMRSVAGGRLVMCCVVETVDTGPGRDLTTVSVK